MRKLWTMIVGVTAIAGQAAAQQIPVLSDPRARYYLLELTRKPGGMVEALTRREGPSGTSFSLREYDCRRGRFRYLGEGDTLEQALRRRSASTLGPLVEGSISQQVSHAACTVAVR